MSESAAHAQPLPAASPLKRRGWLIGAGAAGAAAVAVSGLPGGASQAAVAASTVSTAQQPVDPAGGYQVSAHVLRYYATTRA